MTTPTAPPTAADTITEHILTWPIRATMTTRNAPFDNGEQPTTWQWNTEAGEWTVKWKPGIGLTAVGPGHKFWFGSRADTAALDRLRTTLVAVRAIPLSTAARGAPPQPDLTNPQVLAAAWQAFQEAPDDATAADLRVKLTTAAHAAVTNTAPSSGFLWFVNNPGRLVRDFDGPYPTELYARFMEAMRLRFDPTSTPRLIVAVPIVSVVVEARCDDWAARAEELRQLINEEAAAARSAVEEATGV